MAKYAHCPKCGFGGKDAVFVKKELVCVNTLFRPHVSGSDEVETNDYYLDSDVIWDTLEPARQVDGQTPRYACRRCGAEFDEFAIVETE